MNITSAQIARARASAEDVWTFGNRVLYRMCEENPDHTEVGTVAGKVRLIGRSYAVAVERRVIPAGADAVSLEEFYEHHIAPALIESDLDQKLKSLQQSGEFSAESLPEVLDAHYHLVFVLRRLTHQDKRSFASKYLHFHAPAQVPIFDSIAARVLSQMLPRRRIRRGIPGGFDQTYTRFVSLLLDLRHEIESDHGVRLSTRELDRLLLQAADGAGSTSRPHAQQVAPVDEGRALLLE